MDPEDGTSPLYTYGMTVEEILEKAAKTTMNAQFAARRVMVSGPSQPATAAAAPRPKLSAGDVMQATLDLTDPSKSGNAVVKLFENSTGLNPMQIVAQNFANLAMEWQAANPHFYAHPGNKKLLADTAKSYVGGELGRVTKELLTQAYQQLYAQGYLMEAPDPANANEPEPHPNPNPQPPAFPGESPVQRTVRPRGEANYATQIPSNRLRTAQTPQPRTPKYTEEQIRTMPEDEARRLIASNDPDYAEACERLFGATA